MPEIDDEMKNWDEEEKRMEKLVLAKAKAEDYNTSATSSTGGSAAGAKGELLSGTNEEKVITDNMKTKKSASAPSKDDGNPHAGEANQEANIADGDTSTGEDGERLRSASTKRLIAAELRLQVKRERVFRDAFAIPPESPVVKERSPFKDTFSAEDGDGNGRVGNVSDGLKNEKDRV